MAPPKRFRGSRPQNEPAGNLSRKKALLWSLSQQAKELGEEAVKKELKASFRPKISFSGSFRQDLARQEGYEWQGSQRVLQIIQKPKGVTLWKLREKELSSIVRTLKHGWLKPVLLHEKVVSMQSADQIGEDIAALSLRDQNDVMDDKDGDEDSNGGDDNEEDAME